MKKKLTGALLSSLLVFAAAAVTTASWVWMNQPKVPQSLLKK